MPTLTAPTSQSFGSRTSQPLKLIALGDSIVYGFGDPIGGGWVERLRRSWMSPDRPGPVLYNLGIRGDGVKQVKERLEQEFRCRGELKNQVPDYIILSVGVNDSARLGRTNGRHYTDFNRFQEEITNLLDQAQQLCPILFVGMVPVDEAKMPFLDCFYYSHADQYLYKEATKLACQERKISYLDIFDLWKGRGENWWREQLCVDGLHPNVIGYQSLLQDVLNWEPMQRLSRQNLEQIALSN